MKKRRVVLATFGYPVLMLIAVTVLYPLLWMVNTSFKTNKEILLDAFALPATLRLDNYESIFTNGAMGQYFINSLIVTVVSVVVLLVFSTMAAYGFSAFRFRYRNLLYLYCLIGLMVPAQALIVSNFNWISLLGLLSTYWALIFTYLGWGSLGILVLRDFFNAVPQDLKDAARIDGANHLQVFLRILLPLARPSLATVSIFYIMWIWNDYVYPLIFMQKPEMFTVPLGIMFMTDRFSANWGDQMAGLTVASIPPIIAYLVFQRQFVKGLMAGALKG